MNHRIVSMFVSSLTVLCVFLSKTFASPMSTPTLSNNHTIININCSGVVPSLAEKGAQLTKEDFTSPSSQNSSSPWWVCENSPCCGEATQMSLHAAVTADLQAAIDTEAESIKSLLSITAQKLNDEITTLVRQSGNNTKILFQQVYRNMAALAVEPIQILYDDLEAFVLGVDTSIRLETSVTTFFDSLFPLVYHNTLSSSSKDFSPDYKDCLRNSRGQIKPFGDVPRKIIAGLERSLEAGRTLGQALQVSIEVLNASTRIVPLPEDCPRALMRVRGCSLCSGVDPSVYACRGLCVNAARGCVSGWAWELDQPWTDLVSGLERAAALLIDTTNRGSLPEILGAMDARISEAVMVAMENGPHIDKRVQNACGSVRRSTSNSTTEASPAPLPTTSTALPSTNDRHNTLKSIVNKFSNQLAVSRTYFSILAENICMRDGWSADEGQHCWNGKDVADYVSPVAGTGVSAQKYNPEVRVHPRVSEPRVAQFADKLRHVKQLLQQSYTVRPSPPRSYNLVLEGDIGSGSGFYHPPHWGSEDDSIDDDDWGRDGSGSGDYKPDKTPTEDNTDPGVVIEDEVEITKSDKDIKTTSASIVVMSQIIVVMLSSLTIRCFGVWLNG